MSIPSSIIRCTKCDLAVLHAVSWGNRVYEFPNGLKITLYSRLGWCHRCATLVPVESFDKESSDNRRNRIEEAIILVKCELSKARGWLQSFLGINKNKIATLENKLDRLLNELEAEQRLKMITSRLGGARCLICSSTDILNFDIPHKEEGSPPEQIGVAHPGCGGQLIVAQEGARVGVSFKTVSVYDPNGIFVREDKLSKHTRYL